MQPDWGRWRGPGYNAVEYCATAFRHRSDLRCSVAEPMRGPARDFALLGERVVNFMCDARRHSSYGCELFRANQSLLRLLTVGDTPGAAQTGRNS